MNAFISLVRHYTTYWFTKLAILIGLPDELKNQTIERATEAVAIVVSWAVVKYLVPHIAKISKGVDVKKGASLVLLLGVSFLFSSCSNVELEGEFRSPISGVRYEDGRAVIDEQTRATWLTKAVRLLAGEKPQNVILPILTTEK